MVSIKAARPQKKKAKTVLEPAKVEKKKKTKLPKHFVLAPKDDEVEADEAPRTTGDGLTKKPKTRYVMPTKYITENIVDSCVNALLQLAEHYKKKNKLFDDETPIFAELHSIKIQTTKGNVKLLLANSTVPSTGEVCLITPDLKKGRKPDHEPTVDQWEETLRKAGVTAVKTILPMRQLRVEYDQYELKRRLLTQHDFIMVDTRVLNHVSHVLGKMFFKKHNMLIPVRLEDKDVKKAIDVGLRTVMLRLSEGATSTVVVGHTGMPKKQLKENILSLVQQLKDKYPGGEANIQSINLKLPLSLSLPLYITLRPSNTQYVPKLKHRLPKNSTIVEGDLSTKMNSTVRVAPDGTVHVSQTRVDDSEMEDNEDIEDDDEEIQDEKQEQETDKEDS